MKKILILAHSPYMGGAEIALKSLVDSLNGKFEFTIVIPSNVQIDNRIKNTNANYIYLPLPWWCYEFNSQPAKISKQELFNNYKKLLDIAKNHDILLTNTVTIPWLGFAANELAKPHIWYIHEFGDIDHNLQFILGYKKSLAIINDTSTRVLTISNAVYAHISRYIDKNKIDIIHQAIDLDKLSSIKPIKNISKETHLLCMGALKPSKGQHIAIEAVKILYDKKYSINLDIVGPTADEQYVKTLLKNGKDVNYININNRAYNIVDELSLHDALLMCSSNEALGRVTIEAMAASVPVIGYASPSTKYLLSNKRGILYKKNNAKELAEAIIKFINNKNEVNINEAKKFVSLIYNPSNQAKDFLKCVNNVDKNKPIKGNYYFKYYVKELQNKGIIISSFSSNLSKHKIKIIKITPKFIKKPIKKILR